MATFRPLTLLTTLSLIALSGAPVLVTAQTLTPGAAAVGGTTGSGELIAPGGGRSTPQTGGTTTTNTGSNTGSSGRRLHYPSSNWILSNPPVRTQVRGAAIATFQGDANDLRNALTLADQTPATTQPADTFVEPAQPAVTTQPVEAPADGLSPVFVPTDTQTAEGSEVATVQTPVDTANTAITAGEAGEAQPGPGDTTSVTAGATQATAPTQSTDTDLSPATVAAEFEMASLPFGISDTELTPDHIFRLEAVVAQMRAEPLTPLNVVAVIAQADGDNEDVKLLARKRILAVRRHILSQGVSSDYLTFKITATAAT